MSLPTCVRAPGRTQTCCAQSLRLIVSASCASTRATPPHDPGATLATAILSRLVTLIFLYRLQSLLWILCGALALDLYREIKATQKTTRTLAFTTGLACHHWELVLVLFWCGIWCWYFLWFGIWVWDLVNFGRPWEGHYITLETPHLGPRKLSMEIWWSNFYAGWMSIGHRQISIRARSSCLSYGTTQSVETRS